jgi:oligopeptide/dipeptide ABC transporter ATP-binding protein
MNLRLRPRRPVLRRLRPFRPTGLSAQSPGSDPSASSGPGPLLELDQLALKLPVDRAVRPILHDVSFSLGRGEVLALVGESGSGKSMTARAVMRLLPPGAVLEGRIAFDGASLLSMTGAQLRDVRQRHVGMIFQDPRTAINPVHRIGDYVTEAVVRQRGWPKSEALRRAEQLLEEVGIDDPRRRLRQYPHELSGGMLQRVMIASVLLAEPELILADEPTTALDVTTQSEVVAILDELRRARGMAMLFITHDLELAAAIADRVAVMYAGYIVEVSTPGQLRAKALHPYTAALLASRPSLQGQTGRLVQIPGRPRSAFEAPPGCPFQDRCSFALEACFSTPPGVEHIEGGMVRCLRAIELRRSDALVPRDAAPIAPGNASRATAAEAARAPLSGRVP